MSPSHQHAEASTAPGLRRRMAHASHALRLMPLVRTIRGWFRRDLRILAYHRVARRIDDAAFDFDIELLSAGVDAFRAQMAHLRDHYEPIRLGDVVDALDAGRPLPRRAVVVTFDDGYDDNHDLALPILRETGVRATFFVSTDHIDSGLTFAFDWLAHAVMRAPDGEFDLPGLGPGTRIGRDRAARRAVVARLLDRVKAMDAAGQSAALRSIHEALGTPPAGVHADSRPMDWDKVRALRDAGMEIGSHGASHRMLAKLDEDGIRAELAGSRDAIARELGAPPRVLAYPVGGRDAFDSRVIAIARETGFRLACSYLPGVNPLPGADWYALRRVSIERDTRAAMFAAVLAAPEVFANRERVMRR